MTEIDRYDLNTWEDLQHCTFHYKDGRVPDNPLPPIYWFPKATK